MSICGNPSIPNRYRDVMIMTDAVDSDIPLLLSVKFMKNAKVKLDLDNGTAEIVERKCVFKLHMLGWLLCWSR